MLRNILVKIIKILGKEYKHVKKVFKEGVVFEEKNN